VKDQTKLKEWEDWLISLAMPNLPDDQLSPEAWMARKILYRLWEAKGYKTNISPTTDEKTDLDRLNEIGDYVFDLMRECGRGA
jgi:hypothetical protein